MTSTQIRIALFCQALFFLSGCGQGEDSELIELDESGLTRTLVNESFGGPQVFQTISGGTWSVASGQLRLSSPSNAAPLGNIAVHPQALPEGSFSVSAWGMAANESTWDDFALVFNFQDAQNYYFASFNEQNDGQTSGLFRVRGGVATQLSDIRRMIRGGAGNTVKVTRIGARLAVSLNGAIVANATDSTFSGGKAGVASKNNSCAFDDFVIVTESTSSAGPSDAGTSVPQPQQPSQPQDAGTPAPPPVEPPPSTGGTGTHPFPFSFNDSQFFANVVAAAPFNLACGTKSDLSLTQHREPAAIVNSCGSGTSTLERVRLGGDLGANGDIREGYRCTGSGTMNILSSWLEAKGTGADHADVVQCYDPNNAVGAVMNVKNTTIRAYNSSATAGLFVADNYALDLRLTNVMFWGGPYGLRFHTDGRPGSISLNNVCFYGTGSTNHSFGAGPFLLTPYKPNILEWNNVNWCTIENGQLVVHGSIPKP